MEFFLTEATESFFSGGLHLQHEISDSAVEIGRDLYGEFNEEKIYNQFKRGNQYGYVSYIIGTDKYDCVVDYKEDGMHMGRYTHNYKKVPPEYIKAALFRIDLGNGTEYYVVENDKYLELKTPESKPLEGAKWHKNAIGKWVLSGPNMTMSLGEEGAYNRYGVRPPDYESKTKLPIGTDLEVKMKEIASDEKARDIGKSSSEIRKYTETKKSKETKLH